MSKYVPVPKSLRVCVICGEGFSSSHARKAVCGDKCKKTRDKATQKKWRAENLTKSNVWRKEYYETNKDTIKANTRKWVEENRKYVNAQNRKRRYGAMGYKRRAKKEVYEAGFSSLFEMHFSEYLQNKDIPYEYETEKLEWGKKQVAGLCSDCGSENVSTYHTYRPDFIFMKKNGEKMYVELKGKFTGENRTKMREVKKTHPEKDIRFVFQQSKNKLNKGAKKTYGQWAERKGYPYVCCKSGPAFLPDEWLDEIDKSWEPATRRSG